VRRAFEGVDLARLQESYWSTCGGWRRPSRRSELRRRPRAPLDPRARPPYCAPPLVDRLTPPTSGAGSAQIRASHRPGVEQLQLRAHTRRSQGSNPAPLPRELSKGGLTTTSGRLLFVLERPASGCRTRHAVPRRARRGARQSSSACGFILAKAARCRSTPSIGSASSFDIGREIGHRCGDRGGDRKNDVRPIISPACFHRGVGHGIERSATVRSPVDLRSALQGRPNCPASRWPPYSSRFSGGFHQEEPCGGSAYHPAGSL